MDTTRGMVSAVAMAKGEVEAVDLAKVAEGLLILLRDNRTALRCRKELIPAKRKGGGRILFYSAFSLNAMTGHDENDRDAWSLRHGYHMMS